MLRYVGHRIIQTIPLLVILSILIFVIIQLPPGDWLTMYVQNLRLSGSDISEAEIQRTINLYRLDKPMHEQYFFWIRNIVTRLDFGRSFTWNAPVTEVIGERMAMTVTISILTILFTWSVSLPIGVYSATHQYSFFDYLFTFLGFIGLSVPGFLVALVILYVVFERTGVVISGLFSAEFVEAPWSLAKVVDLLKHIWLPMIVIGLSGTAALIRTMRGLLLDELQRHYVITARAKGLEERKLLFKYPVRLAVNPMISTIGWLLPSVISGEALVSIVLNMPTTGPLILKAMMAQDMYLAGSFLLITSTLTVIGTLISDVLLAWVDPRIRFGAAGGEA